ncbi:MAG TPA: hypothetical protein VHT94_15550 [Streptosporangiaceae bacterium]|nr:hypothetical protein [Streptosporangiaceae bacterium]
MSLSAAQIIGGVLAVGVVRVLYPASNYPATTGPRTPTSSWPRKVDWDLPDPAGLDVAAVRPIGDDIHQRVRQLLSELDAPA